MKFAALFAFAPLLSLAAPATLEVRQNAGEDAVVVKFDAFATGSKVEFSQGLTGRYVGQHNTTDNSLFQFGNDVYSIHATHGTPLKGYWGGDMGFKRNGLCDKCIDDTGSKKRDLEERTGGVIIALVSLKVRIIKSFLECFFFWIPKDYPSGCLDKYPPSGCVWVGGCGGSGGCDGGNHGHQCTVGSNGYLNWGHISHIGWDNGFGGKYCGSWKGVQYWNYQGRVCPVTVKRGHKRPGCHVPRPPKPEPPVCNVCNDPNDYWKGRPYHEL